MLYTIADGEALMKLRKVVSPSGEEMELIYSLYKKYINPNARPYRTGCSCENDIASYYWGLMEWYYKKEALFINE